MSERKRLPRFEQLLEMCEQKAEELSNLILRNLNSCDQNSEALQSYISDIKSTHVNFSTICHDCICSLYKCGSVSEATSLRERKRELKQEVKESVSLAISLLQNLGIDGISNIETISSISEARSGRAESVLSDFADDNVLSHESSSKPAENPLSIHSPSCSNFPPVPTQKCSEMPNFVINDNNNRLPSVRQSFDSFSAALPQIHPVQTIPTQPLR